MHARKTVAPPLLWNRPRLRYLEGAADEGGEGTSPGSSDEAKFTQTDVDRIVQERLQRQARTEFGDYAELKAKADGAKSLEQQVSELASKYAESEARALRSDIAARFGIAPEDRDLFLTGVDEESLTAQAKRLQERESDKKQRGNVSPKEGTVASKTDGKGDMRDFTRQLFARADD